MKSAFNSTRNTKKAGNEKWLVFLVFLAVFFEYVRPQTYLPGFRFQLVLSLLLFVLWLAKANKDVLSHPLIKLNIACLIFTLLSITYSVNYFSPFEKFKLVVTYLIAFTLPFIAWVNTADRLKTFFVFWLVIHLYIAIFSINSAGMGVGSFLKDENDLALVMTMCIPFAYFMAQMPGNSSKARWFYYTTAGFLVFAVVVSFSRGGFVGLICVLFALWWGGTAKEKIKQVILVLVLLAVIFPFIPKGYFSEVQTISDTSESTAADRIYMWTRGFEMFLDNPILGVGAGNYNWKIAEYEMKSDDFGERIRNHGGMVAHSLYFTIIPEYGLVGIIMFGAIFYLIYSRAGKIYKAAVKIKEQDDELFRLGLLARAIRISLIGYLSAGAFISVLYYPHVWFLLAFVVCIEQVFWTKFNTLKENEEAGSFRRQKGL